MLKKYTEGDVTFYAPIASSGKISKELPVFYNPAMIYNRDTTIKVLKALGKKEMDICMPLEGTGVRSIRILKELPKGIVTSIIINDIDPDAVKVIKKNAALNKVKPIITNLDANVLLASSKAFDFIDIDPFGSPNPFLNNAIMHLKRDGVLAVTATDTAALCGAMPNVCIRKYWGKPLHTAQMHEIGLRILIRKVQLLGMQFERAMTPLISFSKDHYMRVFFVSHKSKSACDAIAQKHGEYHGAGPLWLGSLHDAKLLRKIDDGTDTFLRTLRKEIDTVGFFDIPTITKQYKINCEKKMVDIISAIRKTHRASRTHAAPQGIKTDMELEEFVNVLKR